MNQEITLSSGGIIVGLEPRDTTGPTLSVNMFTVSALIPPLWERTPLTVVTNTLAFPRADHAPVGVRERERIEVGGFSIYKVKVGDSPAKMIGAATEKRKRRAKIPGAVIFKGVSRNLRIIGIIGLTFPVDPLIDFNSSMRS